MPQKDFKENILAEPAAVYGYNNQKHDPYFIDPLGISVLNVCSVQNKTRRLPSPS
jgi:hypothetical protein